MILKLLKALKDSISSVSGVTIWEDVAKDLVKQQITRYPHKVRNQPTIECPKFVLGQLVRIRYNHHWRRLHHEVGIITEVCNYDPIDNGPAMHFYEVVVGGEKITIIERYLDGNVEE
tara:strand:+ start:592 stop:942 length:351 start_codon:yes stop_codon:yes gene_type:complete